MNRPPFFPTLWGLLADPKNGALSSRRVVGFGCAAALALGFLISGLLPAILTACGAAPIAVAFDPKLTDALTWLAMGGILGATADGFTPKARVAAEAEAEVVKARASQQIRAMPDGGG